MESVVCLLALLIICWFLYILGFFVQKEYGIVGLVYAAIALLNVLFTMGMESAYLRYAKDREQSANLFKTLQLFLLGSSLLLVGVLWLLAPFITPELGIRDQARYLLVHDWYSFL